MDLIEAFRDDSEAVARVGALMERLQEDVKPHARRIPELLIEAEKRNPDAEWQPEDVLAFYQAGRLQATKAALRALFGDRIHFDDRPGQPIVEFKAPAAEPDWWAQLFG